MATNEQMRRASGAAMEQARRAGGASMEQSRRAGGARMESERRGSDIADDLNALANPPTKRRSLPPIGAVGGIPATRGRAVWNPASAPTAGGGIASPLTEKTVTVGEVVQPDREYWPNGLASNDGMLVIPAIKTLNLIDANGAAVQVQLAEPPA